jgi:AraC family transcriptional regulator
MRTQTLNTYRELALKAVDYIYANLDGDLSCAVIADGVSVSSFYFHRVFKAVVGEGPLEMVSRLRMERSAHDLEFSDKSITEIAFEAGFDSLEGFSRHFRSRFNRSPSEYRRSQETGCRLPTVNGIHWQEGSIRPTITLREDLFMSTETLPIRVVELDDLPVAAIRHTGPYYLIGQAFSKLHCAGSRRRMIAIFYDNPETTPEAELRSDACIELRDGDEMSPESVKATLMGGKYAVTRYVGPFSGLPEAWSKFMTAMANTDHKFRDEPCFEEYLSDMDKTPQDKLETDLFAAIV